MKALILAGGFGKRLRPLTDERPKPLLVVGGKTILDWQIEWLKSYGITSFVITSSHLSHKIVEHLEGGEKHGVDVKIVVEEKPLGKGGAIRNCRDIIGDDDFVVTNGDVITNLEIGRLKLEGNEVAAMAIIPLRSSYGIVKLRDSKVVGFEEKPLIRDHWVNAGAYLLTKEIFGMLPEKGEIEDTAFPELASSGRLRAVKFEDRYWRSVDSMKDYEEVDSDLKNSRVY